MRTLQAELRNKRTPITHSSPLHSPSPVHLPSLSHSPSPSYHTEYYEVGCDREVEHDREERHIGDEECSGITVCDREVVAEYDNEEIAPQIDRSRLWKVDAVLLKHRRDVNVCTAGRLTCKLARLAFFGEDVMKACTPLGGRNLPGLPQREMAELKSTVMSCFPVYNCSPSEFEDVWEKCLTALQQSCNKLRH